MQTANPPLCIAAHDVQKAYGKAVALKGVSLEMRSGEILALLGPNGAGKTTFIKILATVLEKDQGQVEILGYDLNKQQDEIRYMFGYVGQDTERSAYARLTVLENLHFFGALWGLSKQYVNQQIDELVSFFSFEAHTHKLFEQLSAGQKQTVVIMRAMLHDPALLYLDEPTKGLDPIIAHKTRAFLKNYIRRGGKSLLLTSHILTEVEQLADRVALIHQGEIGVLGSPAELMATIGATEFVELPKGAMPTAIVEKILQLEPVLFSVDREPDWVTLAVTNFLDGTEAVIRVLRDEGIHTMFRHHTVSLEDAFLHHVGVLSDKFD